MGAIGQWITPRFTRDNSALMGGVKHHLRPDSIRHRADFGDRMLIKIEARPDCNQLWLFDLRQYHQRIGINCVPIRQNGGGNDPQSIKTRASRHVVRRMTADRRGGCDDRITGFACRHEPVKVGDRTGRDADFCKICIEDFGTEGGADDFDFFNRLQPHFIFVTGIPKRRARPDAR